MCALFRDLDFAIQNNTVCASRVSIIAIKNYLLFYYSTTTFHILYIKLQEEYCSDYSLI